MPLMRRGFLSAVAAKGARGAPPVVREEETVQRVHSGDGHLQGAGLEETEAVPLCALPAGFLRTGLVPRTLSGAPASQGGGGHPYRGLHASRRQSLSLTQNVLSDCLFCLEGLESGE